MQISAHLKVDNSSRCVKAPGEGGEAERVRAGLSVTRDRPGEIATDLLFRTRTMTSVDGIAASQGDHCCRSEVATCRGEFQVACYCEDLHASVKSRNRNN